MRKNLLLAIGGWLCALQLLAQSEEVVMRIGERRVSLPEFTYAYRLSAAEAGAQALPLKAYAERFALRCLKVAAARSAGLDTLPAFRRQQEAGRVRLLEASLVDKRVADSVARVRYGSFQPAGGREQVRVMQVLRRLPQAAGTRYIEREKERMDSLYRAIVAKPQVPFGQWVERYSDDRAQRWMEQRQATAEVEHVAFSLGVGEVSEPFYSPEGIHILMVTERKSATGPEETAALLQARLSRGDGLPAHVEAAVERLKQTWDYRLDLAAMSELLAKGKTSQTLFTIAGEPYTGEAFQRFSTSYPRGLKRQLEAFVAKSLLDYEHRNVERRHPELRYALQEQEERYLEAAATRQYVDLPAADERGLALFFRYHASRYRWELPRYRGIVVCCADKQTAKAVRKLLKKLPLGRRVEALQEAFNAGGVQRLQVAEGLFAVGDHAGVDRRVFKLRMAQLPVGYPFVVVEGDKQKGPESYEEVKEQVSADYREQLAAEWVSELRKTARIELYREVLKTVNNNPE